MEQHQDLTQLLLRSSWLAQAHGKGSVISRESDTRDVIQGPHGLPCCGHNGAGKI